MFVIANTCIASHVAFILCRVCIYIFLHCTNSFGYNVLAVSACTKSFDVMAIHVACHFSNGTNMCNMYNSVMKWLLMQKWNRFWWRWKMEEKFWWDKNFPISSHPLISSNCINSTENLLNVEYDMICSIHIYYILRMNVSFTAAILSGWLWQQ